MRSALIATVLYLSLLPLSGSAAQRTFVSSVGSDANPCAIATPCRSFATALTHTDANGEIIVLDSAGYGPVIIDRSVSITAPPGVYAGVSVFAGDDGVKIAGGGIDVALRGLTINGQGGNRGIFYTLGASLRISNCIVSNMSGAGVSVGFGGEIVIEDSLIRDNAGAGLDIILNPNVIVARTTIDRNGTLGIDFMPSASAASLSVTASHIVRNALIGIRVNPKNVPATFSLTHSTVARNVSNGVYMSSSNGSSPITAALSDNSILQNSVGVTAFSAGGVGLVTGALTGNFISAHANAGVSTFNTGALLVLDHNTVTHNFFGVSRATGSVIETRSSNTVRENGTDTFGTPFTAVGGV